MTIRCGSVWSESWVHGWQQPESRRTVARCQCFNPLLAHFSQVRTVPWYKGGLPFFVEGKITVSCSFGYSFSYMNLITISIIFSVVAICIPLSVVTANMSSVQKDCQDFECWLVFFKVIFKAPMNCDNVIQTKQLAISRCIMTVSLSNCATCV